MTSVLPEPRGLDHNPSLLRPGTLIYLWPPGQDGGDSPIRVRVERANAHTIIGNDLSDGRRSGYFVGCGLTDPPGMAWTWEIAELPGDRMRDVSDFLVIERDDLTAAERARILFGAPGTPLLFRLHGGDTVRGVVSRISVDQAGEIGWVEVTGPADVRGPVVHRLKLSAVAGITEQGSA